MAKAQLKKEKVKKAEQSGTSEKVSDVGDAFLESDQGSVDAFAMEEDYGNDEDDFGGGNDDDE